MADHCTAGDRDERRHHADHGSADAGDVAQGRHRHGVEIAEQQADQEEGTHHIGHERQEGRLAVDIEGESDKDQRQDGMPQKRAM